MARRDPRYTGLDVIRIFENNLSIADKRLTIAWFFSLIPVKEPKIDAISLILDLLSLVPIAGTIGRIFQISIATAQAAADIAQLFRFELEEEEVELGRLRLENRELVQEVDRLQNSNRRLLTELEQAEERIQALLTTQSLLEEELQGTIPLSEEQKRRLKIDIEAIFDRVNNSTGACGLFLLPIFSALTRVATFIRRL